MKQSHKQHLMINIQQHGFWTNAISLLGFLACYILSTLWELGKHMQYISECYVCKIKAILDMNI